MKTKIEIEIDVDQIAQEMMEKEGQAGYSSIKYAVQNELKKQAVDSITRDILNGSDIKSFVEQRSYSGEEYLTQLAKETITTVLKGKAEAFIQEWVKNNMKNVFDRSLREIFESNLIKNLQRMVSRIIVVNEDAVDEQMKEMEDAFMDQAKGAYESGQMDATAEIRRSI